MSFTEDACRLIAENTPPFESRVADYVPRILLREGTEPEQAKWFRWLKSKGDAADANVINDIDILKLTRVAIIGNAGSGKSQILSCAYLNQCRRFLENQAEALPFFLDLATQLPINLSIDTALTSLSRGLFNRAATEHPSGTVLFLDGLDDVLLKNGGRAFYNDLRSFIESCPPRWKIVLACRRSFWDPIRFQGMEPGIVVFHCDYLDQEAYQHLIPEGLMRSRFFTTIHELGIEAFVDSPFVGFDLARSFMQGDLLPYTRKEWFDQQITKRLSGTSIDQDRGQLPPLTRLKYLSQQLACIASFCGVNTWLPQEATNLLGESAILTSEHPVQFDEVYSLLQTLLFKKTGESFSFFHQSFTEYLAANALVSLPLRKQRQLLERIPN